MPTISIDKEKILKVASKSLETCLSFRAPRLEEIKRSEDMSLGKTKPALKGRFNIPVPILEGYIQTLMSKIDDQISVKYQKGRESTLKTAKKVTSAWERESAPDRGNYNGADLDAKILAIYSGFGVLQLIPTKNPFSQKLIAVDYYDLIFEPFGGQDIESHIFKGKMNCYKTKQELIDGVKKGIYDEEGVNGLINNIADDELKKTTDDAQQKINRFIAMGMNPSQFNFIGENVYNLVEMEQKYEGEDYYILFSYEKQKVIECRLLKDKYPSGSAFISWHTERNPVNFMSRAPVDSVRPVAEAMRILINQNFDNIQRRNWDMILYNAKKIMDPKQFEFRPNGLISVKLNDGESLDNAYRQMNTPDTSSTTINLLQFLNAFIGEKSGVTPTSQGAVETQTLGIQNNIIAQTSDRFGLLNKQYTQAHVTIAKKFKENLGEFMPAKGYMIKYAGINGLQDEELTREEVREELDVQVISRNAEAIKNQEKNEKRRATLDRFISDPMLRAQVGERWLAEELLRSGEYEEDEVKSALNKESGYNQELMSEGAKSIEMILAGEEPKLNRGANIQFVRKIMNYAIDESDTLNDETYLKLMKYANDHLQIVQENEQRMANLIPTPEVPNNMNPKEPTAPVVPTNPAVPTAPVSPMNEVVPMA